MAWVIYPTGFVKTLPHKKHEILKAVKENKIDSKWTFWHSTMMKFSGVFFMLRSQFQFLLHTFVCSLKQFSVMGSFSQSAQRIHLFLEVCCDENFSHNSKFTHTKKHFLKEWIPSVNWQFNIVDKIIIQTNCLGNIKIILLTK